MKLSRAEETLLRKLVVSGDQKWQVGLDKEAFDGLQVLGYARRTSFNGSGHWAMVTPRGILKALSYGMIARHPQESESSSARLAALDL
ncbi:MAG: hypothetical protein V3S71_05495 [Acidobacteriota bacterium]